MSSQDKDNNSSKEQEIVIDDEDKKDIQQAEEVGVEDDQPILDPQPSPEIERMREELTKSKDMYQRSCIKAREQQLRIEHLEKVIDSKHDILAGKEQENDRLDEASRKLKELELKEINNDLEIEYYKGDALKKNELIGELRRKEALANNKNGELSRKNLALLNEMDVMKKKEEASISREGELSRIILTLEEELNRTKKKEEEFISRESELSREIDELKLAKDELCRKNGTLLEDLNEMKKKEKDSIYREEELTRKNLDLMEALDATKKREEDYSNREREFSKEISALKETLNDMRRKVEEDEKRNKQRSDEIAGDFEGLNQSADDNLDWINENNDEWPQSEIPEIIMGEDISEKNEEAPIMKKDSKADETMEGEEDSGIIREGSIKKRKKSSEANEVKWWEMRRSSRLEAKHMELYESDDDETYSEPTVKKLKLVSRKAPILSKGQKDTASTKKNQPSGVTKMNSTDLECPECEYRGKTAQSFTHHLREKHSTTLALSGLALRCDCGAEVLSYWHSLTCDIANFTVIRKAESTSQKTKMNNTELECPECEYRGKTANSLVKHLQEKHSTTLALAGLLLRCDCGAEVLSYKHSLTCDIANFTVIRKTESTAQKTSRGAKMNTTDLECPECEYRGKTSKSLTCHLRVQHSTTLALAGLALRCDCGAEVLSSTHSLTCDIANFTVIRKTESTTEKTKMNTTELGCPECEYRGKTAQSFTHHLREKHSTTLELAGLALRCDCGVESFSYRHSLTCDIANFTVIRKREGPIRTFNDAKTTPQCILCEEYPKTAGGYIQHLRLHHKTTLIEKGIYLICSCGVQVSSSRGDIKHEEECNPREFTLHKLDD